MKIVEHFLDGAFTFRPEPRVDSRGEFTRLYCEKEFQAVGIHRQVVQINSAFTKKRGVIRGMHFQLPPKKETKIVRCVQGSLLNVIVDLRRGSPTFLQWHSQLLTYENKLMVYIPSGFAHGCQTLEDTTEQITFHTDFYSKDHEGCIRFDEPKVGIQWPLEVTEFSDKDRACAYLDPDYQGMEW